MVSNRNKNRSRLNIKGARLRKPSGAGELALLEKYCQLSKKYEALVHKWEDRTAHQSGVFHLAWWALNSTSSSMALIQDDAVTLANPTFYQLSEPPDGLREWRPLTESLGPTATSYPSLRDLALEEARSMVASGQNQSLRAYERIGANHYMEFRLETLKSAKRRTRTILLLGLDVTERIQMQRTLIQTREALSQREQMRSVGELASGVAHDLNNVFNVLTLRLSLLRKNQTCMGLQGKNIETLGRVLQDAVAMVRRLQDFARRRQDRPSESIELQSVIPEAVEMVRTEIEERASLDNIQIRIDLQLPTLPAVCGVAAELRPVFVNLLLNARDEMPRGGEIRVSAEQAGEQVVVKFDDQGRGFREEHLEKIFQPLFTTKKGGTGLGLSIAYGVMKRLGGSITAANRAHGGATLSLSFPVFQSASRESHAEVTPSVAPRELPPGRRVLLIDDQPANLEITKDILEEHGVQVDVAISGSEAFALLEEGRGYDLVLCDIGLPVMNGWQVAQRVRQLAPEAQLYMLSGWAREISEDDPRRHLADGVLEKPADLDRILALLAAERRPLSAQSFDPDSDSQGGGRPSLEPCR